MNKNVQRLSQLISTFGAGAMVDLPTRSVIVSGLDFWDTAGSTIIAEPRLAGRLEKILKAHDRLDQGETLTLRTPPVSTDTVRGVPRGITAPVFPAWFICEFVETMQVEGKEVRRRRLVRWLDLDPRGRRRYVFDDGRKSEVIPIRFVCACEKGHLQDIDWRWVVHDGAACQEPMWLEERGTSADPGDTSVVCGCQRRMSLQEAFRPGRLGACRGERPWLLDRDPDGCNLNLRLLTRTATNTYFPQVYTVISLPPEEDELTGLVEDLAAELKDVQSPGDIALAKRFNSKVKMSLGPFADAEIFERLQRVRAAAAVSSSRAPKLSEFDVFASGRAEIGQNVPGAKLYAQTLPRSGWDDPTAKIDLTAVERVVAVHRLREVSSLYGFTRFDAAPVSVDGDVEDVQMSVVVAPVSRDSNWLPAIEQFGEGLFIQFNPEAVQRWLEQSGTLLRHEKLVSGYGHWQTRFNGQAPRYPGTVYVLLHSISHALMSEIALDCGYPAAALKERVYALSEDGVVGADRCGILIYTASTGAQGTLGGLVATAPRIAHILRSALQRLEICSNDPVCADHEPDDRSGDRATHGAACHGCLLIAETSCEMRNLFLDRSLLVSTMGDARANFFR
jgi:hypothetical protein